MKHPRRGLKAVLTAAVTAVKEFFIGIGDGKPGPEDESFGELYRAFRAQSLSVIDSAFNSFYILLGNRVQRSRKTVRRDRGAIPLHPLGWEEKEEIHKESAFWKGLYTLVTHLPRLAARPFGFLKRLFSTRRRKDNLLRSVSDAVGFLRRHLGVIVPLLVAIGVFSYIFSTVNAEIVIGAKVNGRKLGLISDVEMLNEAVEEAQNKASNVLGRSFKFPYEVSYYFSGKGKTLTQSQLYASLLDCLGEYISPGYGLYVDAKLVAALKSEEEIKKGLEALLAEVQADTEGYTVALFNDMQISQETFPTQRMMDAEHLVELLRYGSSDYSTLTQLDHVFSHSYRVCSDLGLYLCSSIAEDAYERARKASEDLDFSNTYYYYEENEEELSQVLPVTFSYSKLVSTVGDLPFDVSRVEDPELYEGGEEIRVRGQNGKAVVTTRLTWVKGQLYREETVKEQIFVAPVTQVVRVGSKPLPEENVKDELKVFILPKQGALNSGFGWRDMNGDGVNDDFHTGLDIEAPMYSNIYASLSGTVIFAEDYSTFGKLIRIRHDNGYETYYAHLDEFKVKVGDRVKQGQLIGISGNTGYTTGPHFHFELHKPNGTAVNPLPYMYQSK